jgi:hypothetical protein
MDYTSKGDELPPEIFSFLRALRALRALRGEIFIRVYPRKSAAKNQFQSSPGTKKLPRFLKLHQYLTRLLIVNDQLAISN